MFKSVIITLLVVLSLAFFAAPAQAQRVIVTPSTYAPAGFTVTNSVTTTSSAAAINISTVPVMVYGLAVNTGANTAVGTVWINVFNATSANVTPGTTAAFASYQLSSTVSQSGSQLFPIPFNAAIGLPMSTAMSINCTTTRNGATAPSFACGFVAVTKP